MKIKFCEFSVLKGHSGYMIQMESFLCVTLYALLFFFLREAENSAFGSKTASNRSDLVAGQWGSGRLSGHKFRD